MKDKESSSSSRIFSGDCGRTIHVTQVVAARRSNDYNDWVEVVLFDGSVCTMDMRLDILAECKNKGNVRVCGYSRGHISAMHPSHNFMTRSPWTFFKGGYCIPLCKDFDEEFVRQIKGEPK